MPTDNKYLKIKTWKDKFFYAERLGKDSVAFILINDSTGKIGLIKEFKPPIDAFLTTAFGGSLDKDVEMRDIVKEEVREEAGYIDTSISLAGRSFVSTQMNQYCYLYLVNVTHATKVPKEPQTDMEALAEVVWLWPTDVINGDDWKAITILTKLGIV